MMLVNLRSDSHRSLFVRVPLCCIAVLMWMTNIPSVQSAPSIAIYLAHCENDDMILSKPVCTSMAEP